VKRADIGNFNIEFNISSNDARDEDMFDSGNTIKLKLTTCNILMYNKHT